MSDRAGQFGRGLRRKLCIRVQCDNMLDRAQHGQVPFHDGERTARPFAHQPVKRLQFAALAFMAHPYLLVRIPFPGTIQQEE